MKRRELLSKALLIPFLAPENFIWKRTEQNQFHRCLLEAHRGNSINAPENTLPAIE